MRNINHILQAIKDYKGIRTNAEFAEFLGVSKSAISNWISRGTLDEKLICMKIPEIRLEFLRTGEFPMTEQTEIINTLLRRIEILEQMVARLEENNKRED